LHYQHEQLLLLPVRSMVSSHLLPLQVNCVKK
jgi:hypothetical protein